MNPEECYSHRLIPLIPLSIPIAKFFLFRTLDISSIIRQLSVSQKKSFFFPFCSTRDSNLDGGYLFHLNVISSRFKGLHASFEWLQSKENYLH